MLLVVGSATRPCTHTMKPSIENARDRARKSLRVTAVKLGYDRVVLTLLPFGTIATITVLVEDSDRARMLKAGDLVWTDWQQFIYPPCSDNPGEPSSRESRLRIIGCRKALMAFGFTNGFLGVGAHLIQRGAA